MENPIDDAMRVLTHFLYKNFIEDIKIKCKDTTTTSNELLFTLYSLRHVTKDFNDSILSKYNEIDVTMAQNILGYLTTVRVLLTNIQNKYSSQNSIISLSDLEATLRELNGLVNPKSADRFVVPEEKINSIGKKIEDVQKSFKELCSTIMDGFPIYSDEVRCDIKKLQQSLHDTIPIINEKIRNIKAFYESLPKGGAKKPLKKLTKTSKKIDVRGVSRCVYKGARGGEYVLLKGDYVPVAVARKNPKPTKK